MPIRLSLPETFKNATATRPQVGMWVCSGSALNAEICAGAGLDWLLLDGEHSPNTLDTLLAQLQAVAAYPVHAVVRPPIGDTVLLKQYLDLGIQNFIVPMVDTAADAEAIVKALHYPPRGVRGVGSALGRSARWNRVENYLTTASDTLTLFVQIESATAVDNVEEILAVDGVDGIFCGPSDLSASMGLIGQQSHPDVVAALQKCFAAAKTAGKFVGINAFDPVAAQGYLDDGVDFILVGADVAILARGSEKLADDFLPEEVITARSAGGSDGASGARASY